MQKVDLPLSSPLAFQVARRDGRLLERMFFSLSYNCAGGEPRSNVGRSTAPLRRDGSFASTGAVRQQLSEGRTEVVRYSVKGRVGSMRATGRMRFVRTTTVDATGAQTETCDTGPVEWTARRRGGLAGVTGQRRPVTLELVGGRREIRDLWISWSTGPCPPSGISGALSTKVRDISVGRGGAFRSTGSYVRPGSPGNTIAVTYRVEGSVSGGLARGTFQATTTVTRPDGSVLAQDCQSPVIRWTARSGS